MLRERHTNTYSKWLAINNSEPCRTCITLEYILGFFVIRETLGTAERAT